jgi:hypothetical protein
MSTYCADCGTLIIADAMERGIMAATTPGSSNRFDGRQSKNDRVNHKHGLLCPCCEKRRAEEVIVTVGDVILISIIFLIACYTISAALKLTPQ